MNDEFSLKKTMMDSSGDLAIFVTFHSCFKFKQSTNSTKITLQTTI